MREMNITLYGNPLSTNQLYRSANRGGRCIRYMTSKGRTRKEEYINRAITDIGLGHPINGEVVMRIMLYFGDKRRRDVDNYNKIILDSLQGICYKDDKQVKILTVSKLYDKENPRAEVFIEAI